MFTNVTVFRPERTWEDEENICSQHFILEDTKGGGEPVKDDR